MRRTFGILIIIILSLVQIAGFFALATMYNDKLYVDSIINANLILIVATALMYFGFYLLKSKNAINAIPRNEFQYILNLKTLRVIAFRMQVDYSNFVFVLIGLMNLILFLNSNLVIPRSNLIAVFFSIIPLISYFITLDKLNSFYSNKKICYKYLNRNIEISNGEKNIVLEISKLKYPILQSDYLISGIVFNNNLIIIPVKNETTAANN